MNIAIICAMAEEASMIKALLTDLSADGISGVGIVRGVLDGHEAVLCLSGVGKTSAAAATQLVIDTCAPDVIINIGMAGNCRKTLPLGGVVIAERLVYHDFNMKFAAETSPFLEVFVSDKALLAAARDTLGLLRIPYVPGTVATGDVFVEDGALRDDIAGRTGCDCIDMEGAAVAHIAAKNGVRFFSAKIMSDNADRGALDTFHASLSIEDYGARAAKLVSGMVKHL